MATLGAVVTLPVGGSETSLTSQLWLTPAIDCLVAPSLPQCATGSTWQSGVGVGLPSRSRRPPMIFSPKVLISWFFVIWYSPPPPLSSVPRINARVLPPYVQMVGCFHVFLMSSASSSPWCSWPSSLSPDIFRGSAFPTFITSPPSPS